MATVLNDKKDEENVLSPPQTAGGSVAPAPAAAPTPSGQSTSSAAANRGGSGRFVNIQKYIEANKPKAGQQGLGEQIGQKLGTQAQDIRAGIESAKSKFGQELAPEQERLAQAGQTIGGALQTAQQSPSQLSQNQLDQYKQLREGYIGGPTEFNSSGLQQQQAALNQQAQNTQTEQGRFGLLRQYFGQPTYSRGQQRLDQLLLQSSPGSLRNLQQTAQQQAGGVNEALGGAQSDIQSSLGQLAQQRMAAQKQATDQLGAAQTGLQTGLETQASNLTGQRQNILDQIKAALNNPKYNSTLTAQDLQSIGLDPSALIGKTNLSTFFRPEAATAVNAQQVMTPEQEAQMKALAQLGGQDPASLAARQETPEFRPFNPNDIQSVSQQYQKLKDTPGLAGNVLAGQPLSISKAEELIPLYKQAIKEGQGQSTYKDSPAAQKLESMGFPIWYQNPSSGQAYNANDMMMGMQQMVNNFYKQNPQTTIGSALGLNIKPGDVFSQPVGNYIPTPNPGPKKS